MATINNLQRRKNRPNAIDSGRFGGFFTSAFSCLLLLFPAIATSGPPIPFDNWTNTGGNISAPCPSGYSCSTNVSEQGILQRMLTDRNTGEKFIQLIVADGAVNGDGQMLLENFVAMGIGNNVDGGALKQVITQRGEYNMDYSIVLNTGWADDPNNPTVVINHKITDTTPEGVGFDYTFDYSAHLGPNDVVTGYYYGIRQDITNSSNLNGSNAGGTDTHDFVLRRASGSYVTGSGSVSLAAFTGMMGGGGAGGAAGGGAGGGGMMTVGSTTGGQSNTTINTRGGTTNTRVTINGTSTGAGDAPCGSDPLTGLTPGTPPPCSTGIDPPNPGSVGTGSGAGAAAPGYTLIVPPRGSGTRAPDPQPPGAGGAITMGMGAGAGAPTGGTVTWSAGNEVQVLWIGQVCPGCMTMGMMGGMGGSNGSYSYQAYENLSTGATAATQTLFSSAPITWNDPPFGPRPQ